MSSHDFDARLLPAVLLVEQMVGLQVQHARGLPVVDKPTQPLLAVFKRIISSAVVHHQVAAGLIAGHGHQYLALIVRVIPVGLRYGRLAGGRLPTPVHDGSVRRPY